MSKRCVQLGYKATRTCDECPWRKDVPVGRFPPERYEALRSTVTQPEGFDFSQPVFACHKSHEGSDVACVGFLIVEGPENNHAVRWALTKGAYDPSKLVATGPLYETYEEMATANGAKKK